MQPFDLSALIDSCCAEVLESMYFTSVIEIAHQPMATPVASDLGYAFALRFAGDLHGTFGLYLEAANARTLAANFLGEEEDALSVQEVSEVIGELTNMLCGSVVSHIEGSSKFALTHPEPIASGTLESRQDAETLFTTLVTDTGPIQVWIELDPSGSAVQTGQQARP
jgi:CheY-specific phosphatase CheX